MIRFAKKEDGLAIAKLVLVILKDMELPFLNEVSEETTTQILVEAVQDPTYRYGYKRGLVKEIDGEVAGVAFGYPASEEPIVDEPLTDILEKYGLDRNMKLFIDLETMPNEWYLDTISVDEKYRGQGIGSELLDALPKIAQRDHCDTLGLNVDLSNPHAKRLYERKGFEGVGQLTLSGHLYDHMQKNI